MRLDRTTFALLPTLCVLAFAHGPSIEVTGLNAVTTGDGTFLQATFHPPEGGATLTAVSTPFGSARFESARAGDYAASDRIPVTHQEAALGAATAHRVRLPDAVGRERIVPVTLLFSGGSIVQAQADVAAPPADRRPWLAAGAATALAAALFVLRGVTGNGRRASARP